MSIERMVARWKDAELVTGEQAERIIAFEKDRSRPWFVHAVTGLAGLAIAIGLVSVVAANWDVIAGRAKVVVDLIAVGALGAGVVHWHRRGPSWARETSIIVMYGLVLASVALLGQVYQLGGHAHDGLAVWSVLTALLVTRGRSAMLATLWICGLQATCGAWLAYLADGPVPAFVRLVHRESLALAAVYWAPLVCILVGRSRRVRAARPAFARVFEAIGWAELVLCASLGTLAFYGDTGREQWSGLWLGGLVSAALTAGVWWRLRHSSGRAAARALVIVCLLLSHVPLTVSPGDLDAVAVISFLGLWALVAYTAHCYRRVNLLSAATLFIGLRLLIAYIEVLGSLLGTGLGLIVGGLLTLGLTAAWLRSRRRWAEELAGTGSSELARAQVRSRRESSAGEGGAS